jgi:predicted permease
MWFVSFSRLFVEVCLPIFICVAAGWGLDQRFKLHLPTMVKLNIYLMVPSFIFVHVVDTDLSGHDALRIVAFTATVIALMFACSMAASHLLKLDAKRQQALSLATMFYNAGNFGLPLVTLAFGKEAAVVQVYVLVTMNVSTFTVGLFLAQHRGESARPHRTALLNVLRQPTLYAVAAGALCRFFNAPVKTVPWIWEPMELLAGGLIGFALVTLGVQMSQTKPAPFRAPLLSALGIRLLLGPVLAVGLAKIFAFSPFASASLILAAGAPTAVNTALLTHEFGGDVSFATSAVYYSTLFSMVTTTVLLALLKASMGV